MAAVFVGDSSQGDCTQVPAASRDSCLSSRNFEMGMLLAGVVASRIGLWCFDLAVSQLLQEWYVLFLASASAFALPS